MAENVLFDIIKDVFIKKDVVDYYTEEVIKQNIFMINRIFSIMYPVQAQVMNIPNINSKDVLRLWNNMLYNGRRSDSWIYTKGSKKEKEKAETKKKITRQDILNYCKHYNVAIPDIETALKFYNEEATDEILEVGIYINNSEK